MVETFFKRSRTIHGLRQGPLAGHIDLLADHLGAHGFSRVHSRIQLRLVGHFNRWLEQKGISAEQLDESVIERYCRWLRRWKHVRAEGVCSLVRLLDLLREQCITPRCTTKAVPTARDTLPEKYRCYLLDERGLALLQKSGLDGGRPRRCPPRGQAGWRLSLSPMTATASASAVAPMPKARSTMRASPRMSCVRLKIAAWPLRSARITSNPMMVA